jgi:3-methylcrotonyl-CoA carboxylase alpha subunit
MQWPELESVRIDAGFESGDTVPDCYDSLLGKVIAWAPERELAAARLAAALNHTYCDGVHTNERWLARVLRSRRFLEVRHNIALLEKSAAEFAGPSAVPPEALILAALALHATGNSADASPWARRDGFTPNLAALVSYPFAWQGHNHTVELSFGTDGRPQAASVDVRTLLQVGDVTYERGGCGAASIAARLVERRRQARCRVAPGHVTLWEEDAQYELAIEDPRTREFSASVSSGGLKTPLPGVVVSVPVSVGQKVAAGEVLMVIEAMKMEHTITAPYAGTVQAIHFARGDRVPEASQLLDLVKAAAAPPG